MATAAKQDSAKKAERKKPVRKAPVQKDYSSKLEWLKAMTEYELAQSEVSNKAKVERLRKRITAKRAAAEKLTAEADKLEAEHDALVPEEELTSVSEEEHESDEAGVPQA
jgi:hypothetical protein